MAYLPLKTVTLLCVIAIFMSACATISEEDCLTGNWADLGYKDGTNGEQRGLFIDYTDTCSKYDVVPNKAAYLEQYEIGLKTYCTYERGYARGEGGSSYNQACSGDLATDFAPGYDDGRAVYMIYQERRDLIKVHDDIYDDIAVVKNKLNNAELTQEERIDLGVELRLLQGDLEDAKVDIRAYERIHDLPRHRYDED